MDRSRSEEHLVAEIRKALATDPRLNKLDVRVVVCQGCIHLTGQAASPERSRLVGEIVAELLPGMSIRNETTVLAVTPPAPPEVIG